MRTGGPSGPASGASRPSQAQTRRPARPRAARLTRSAEGEDNPAFLPDGSLLFLSARPAPPDGQPGGASSPVTGQPGSDQPGAAQADAAAGKRALWLLPAGGGEACQLTAPPGGISRLATAAAAPLAAFTCPVLPGASGIADDAQRRKSRADAGVTAILHEAAPVRHWDHDLGPDQLRLLVTVADPVGPSPGWGQPFRVATTPPEPPAFPPRGDNPPEPARSPLRAERRLGGTRLGGPVPSGDVELRNSRGPDQ